MTDEIKKAIEIPLTKGHVAIVDAEDYAHLSQPYDSIRKQ